MEITTTYSFKLAVGPRIYNFNIEAKSIEEAKATLLKDVQSLVVQINTQDFQ